MNDPVDEYCATNKDEIYELLESLARRQEPLVIQSAAIEDRDKHDFNLFPKTGYAVSVVLPLFNEEAILRNLVAHLIEEFDGLPFFTEFVLCENGSYDQTQAIANELAKRYSNVTLVVLPEPSYGRAIRRGIEESQAEIVVVFNADLWCMDFLFDSLVNIHAGYDIVVGSKRLAASHDQRPLIRRLITGSFNTFLRVFFRFRGTDTHGMKTMRRSKALEIAAECITSKEVFDTELILRAGKKGLRIKEVPTNVKDLRPARISLLRRFPSTIRDLCAIGVSFMLENTAANKARRDRFNSNVDPETRTFEF